MSSARVKFTHTHHQPISADTNSSARQCDRHSCKLPLSKTDQGPVWRRDRAGQVSQQESGPRVIRYRECRQWYAHTGLGEWSADCILITYFPFQSGCRGPLYNNTKQETAANDDKTPADIAEDRDVDMKSVRHSAGLHSCNLYIHNNRLLPLVGCTEDSIGSKAQLTKCCNTWSRDHRNQS